MKGTFVRVDHIQRLRLTMIVLPFAYTILSLLLLNLVDVPREVFGFAGYIADFVNDIAYGKVPLRVNEHWGRDKTVERSE